MRIRSTGDDAIAIGCERRGHHLCISYDLPRVVAETGLRRFEEAHGLGGDDVDERTALHAGENRLINCRGKFLFA